ncbi:MAG: hypothetical protein KAQ79_11650, partial [Cyclobacteriaceae bacterium]|nr:hypothetical protein [Cyclobacteriaceae bacterium]
LGEMVRAIIKEIGSGVEAGKIAAKFHSTLVQIIEDMAIRSGVKSIAFSGGVFQNGLLIDMVVEKLSEEYNLYFHKDLSPNDECISYGQLTGYYCMKKFNENKKVIIQSKSII